MQVAIYGTEIFVLNILLVQHLAFRVSIIQELNVLITLYIQDSTVNQMSITMELIVDNWNLKKLLKFAM